VLALQVDMAGWMGGRAALPRPARALLGWSAAWHALIAPVVRRDAALRDRVCPLPTQGIVCGRRFQGEETRWKALP